ncbi:DUF423 domain-containing protein [Sporolactobacillus sp. THM7-7]|nr:DUF423 domain-containing protein [Sporolactobacillus sp. THM7-7]
MKGFIVLGAVFSFLSVAFGAFGAHVLKERLGEHYLSIFETGVQYQMFHGLGLILIGILAAGTVRGAAGTLEWAGWLMTIGVVLFSGSLYILSISRVGAFGAITPFGGIAFLAAWVLVIIAVIKGA